MSLQEFLEDQFQCWSPPAPQVVNRTKYSVTLNWNQIGPFQFIADQLLYRLEKNDKIPPWYVVYRGGKTSKEIDNLAPRFPHKFRLKVILKAEAKPIFAERAIQFYKNEQSVYESFSYANNDQNYRNQKNYNNKGDFSREQDLEAVDNTVERKCNQGGDIGERDLKILVAMTEPQHKWLESRWSEETWTSTDTDGSSVTCFCMAVRCGYLKQVQGMLEERPELIGILNSTNGYPPLTIAVRKGDIGMVRFLVTAGADLNQPSATGQTALHAAVLTGRLPIFELLLEKGADYQIRDVNGLRVEHYAVDSCDLDVLRRVLDLTGDVTVVDNNGWTPLFRALCQGASTAMVEELMVRGSDVQVTDKAGLPLLSVARTATSRHGNRESVLRLVDASYPHQVARANFARVSRKIHNVHSMLKLPSLTTKRNL